jgi:hypothetical protein
VKLSLVLPIAACLFVACQTPAILEPTNDKAGCNPNTEHACAGGGCCLTDWTCGGPQPDLFATCPADQCCDESGDTYLPPEARRRRMPKRRP